ncbi:MAG: methylmalonyl Co-A mutase-associated GTPase MeaB [Deltaproteobacteria bacterium]|nr:methylmalonyl Co-A mutase-associated GTPase MeaB [Deltaproteobacteria bacterium]
MKKTDEHMITKALLGDLLSLARILSKVENRGSELNKLMSKIYPHTGKARVMGITGPPGAGKSTLIDRLVFHYRKLDKKVAVVAVDPSSPYTGGAVLGDRIRMQAHASDSGVFIRSLGTRGKRGGLSHATQELVMVLDAASFDVILVETAGVGQTELDIAKLAQTVVVVLVPESGDSIQVMKAGLMEIADLFVINKCDHNGADLLEREILSIVEKKLWSTPVLKTAATGDIGIVELFRELENHGKYLMASGRLEEKRLEFLKTEIQDILTEQLSLRIKKTLLSSSGKKLLSKLMHYTINPYKVAAKIFKI